MAEASHQVLREGFAWNDAVHARCGVGGFIGSRSSWVLTLVRHGRTLLFDDSNLVEVPYVFRPFQDGRIYEEEFLEHIRGLGLSGVYVDVGAHLGTHTIWFATLCMSTHVHAFEPVQRYADVIERGLTANDLESKVTVHRVGLSDHPGMARNYLSPEHENAFSATGEGVTEDFRVETLDDVVRGPVAVIKLDVEGMEAAALRGATRILSRYRPAVFAEAHADAAYAEIKHVLAAFGYRPTGNVFNSSPTYEFLAPPRRGRERLRPLWNRIPIRVRRAAKKALAKRGNP
jgi:FkbM family methyltransferase